MAAMIGQNSLNKINKNQSSISEKLASGYKINRAADNVEGCAISEKMRDQTRGLNQAYRNSEDGQSLVRTADGAMSETHSVLQRMRELCVYAANDTNTSTKRYSDGDRGIFLDFMAC